MGSQSSIDDMRGWVTKSNAKIMPFDLIIDDGSHKSEDSLLSFRFLWDYVSPGGSYVIEDLTCSANQRWQNGKAHNLNGSRECQACSAELESASMPLSVDVGVFLLRLARPFSSNFSRKNAMLHEKHDATSSLASHTSIRCGTSCFGAHVCTLHTKTRTATHVSTHATHCLAGFACSFGRVCMCAANL